MATRNTSDLDELRRLAPDWISISRRLVPDPEDKRRTVHEYYMYDAAGDRRLLVLAHQSSKALIGFLAHTLSAIQEFDIEIPSVPDCLKIDVSKVNGTEEHIITIVDRAAKRCLLHVVDRDAYRAVIRFWTHPDLPAAIAPFAA